MATKAKKISAVASIISTVATTFQDAFTGDVMLVSDDYAPVTPLAIVSTLPLKSTDINRVFVFKRETPVYLDIFTDDGTLSSIMKSSVKAWRLVQEGAAVSVTMPYTYARKRGFHKA